MTKTIAFILLLAAVACGSQNKSGFGANDDAGDASLANDAADGGDDPLDAQFGGGDADAGQAASCASAIANKSAVGCEYYAFPPDVFLYGGACFAAFIANTSSAPVTISVDRAGHALDVATFGYVPSGTGTSITYAPLAGGRVPAGQVAILFLNDASHLVSCPSGVHAAITGSDPAVHGTGMGDAFHIVTSAPVVAYDMFPYGGGNSAATSATLLLPVSVWGTNYIAVDAYAKAMFGQPVVAFVASEDRTTITINPSSAIVGGGGVAGTAQGASKSYALGKGQILQLTQDAELAGSIVQSDKPIGSWGGHTCLQIAVDVKACDSAHQQIPAIASFGSEYVAVRYRNRYDGIEETPPWRLVGAVAGTQLTYEPSRPTNAPTTLGVGQIAEFTAAGPFVVRSQDDAHPFYVSAHMTGGGLYDPHPTGLGGAQDGRGDPEFVNVVPPAQYLSSYVFFTDPTYPETNLVVVRKKGQAGFSDVTLDCAGTLGGWQAIGSSGAYEYTRVDLVRHAFAPQGRCNNGLHRMQSASPFGVTVWGWGSAETGVTGDPGYSQYVSYAYPAGASVQAINNVVVPPPPPR
jgi:IgGFc binding protein